MRELSIIMTHNAFIQNGAIYLFTKHFWNGYHTLSLLLDLDKKDIDTTPKTLISEQVNAFAFVLTMRLYN